MAYRTFLDDNGRYWQVWESHPHTFERRKGDRRKDFSGWLTFESFTEKRRLAPVPPHWDEMSVHDLLSLWENAKPVSRIGDETSAA